MAVLHNLMHMCSSLYSEAPPLAYTFASPETLQQCHNDIFCTADAELWTTGSNDSCQLGHKGHDTQLWPSRVEALDAHGVCQIACGQQHMLVVADQGALCAWGSADLGQLGQLCVFIQVLACTFAKSTDSFLTICIGGPLVSKTGLPLCQIHVLQVICRQCMLYYGYG